MPDRANCQTGDFSYRRSESRGSELRRSELRGSAFRAVPGLRRWRFPLPVVPFDPLRKAMLEERKCPCCLHRRV